MTRWGVSVADERPGLRIPLDVAQHSEMISPTIPI